MCGWGLPGSLNIDLGTFVEGVVELDPMSGRMVLRIPQDDGSNVFLDIQEQLLKYNGEEIRLIMTPVKTIAEVARLVEAGDVSLGAHRKH